MTASVSVSRRATLAPNNLDTLRLILATLVVLAHTNNLFHVAAQSGEKYSFFLLNLSGVAVSSFFVISGMLTYISFERDGRIWNFYVRRFFRIFPAYWTLIIAQVLLFLLVMRGLVLWDVLPKYLVVNMLTANFLQPSFVETVPAINGSLWTIKIEAAYYVLVPFLFPLLLRTPALLVLAVVSFIWAVALPYETLAKQLPGKFYLFAMGVALARYYSVLTPRMSAISLGLVPVLVAAHLMTKDLFVVSELIEAAMSLLIVVAFLRRWVSYEPLDISYTLYLVHYPLLVVLTRVWMPDQSFAVILCVGVAMSVGMAVVMTLVVERPGLRLGRQFIKTSQVSDRVTVAPAQGGSKKV